MAAAGVTLTLGGASFTVTADRQVTAAAEGQCDISADAARALLGLGGAVPGWALTLLRIDAGLRHCPSETPQEILALARTVAQMSPSELFEVVTVPRWLPMLARDPEPGVRMKVAQQIAKTGVPVDVAVLLASDPDETVRSNLANGRATPAEAALVLVASGDLRVLHDVVRSSPHAEPVLTAMEVMEEQSLQRALASRRVLPEAAWPWLVAHRSDLVRIEVAENGFAPLWALEMLAGDTVGDVANAAADTLRNLAAGIT